MPDDATTTEDPQDGVNRLLGMVVHEVSVVDRAANQRTFLVTKKDPMKPVKKDDSAASPAAPAGDNTAAPEKLAPMQAQVKDQLLAALTSAAEKIVAVANSIKEAETTDQEQQPAVPASVTAQIGEVASMLAGIQSQYGGAPADASTAAAPAKADLAGITENGGASQQGEQKRAAAEIGKALGLLDGVSKAGGDAAMVAKVAEASALLKALHVDITKAGRKMAKERMERFRKAIDLLAGILKELQLQKLGKAAKPAGTAPAATDVVTMKKSDAEQLLASVTELTKAAEEMKTANAALVTDNAALRKRTGAPNSAGAGEGARATVAVDWPMDMNRPIKAKGQGTNFASKK